MWSRKAQAATKLLEEAGADSTPFSKARADFADWARAAQKTASKSQPSRTRVAR